MLLRRLIKLLLSVLCFAVDGLWALWTGPQPTHADAAAPVPPRLLLIRVDRIGDVVLWLPAAKVLIDHYRTRGYQVTLLVSGECLGLTKGLGSVDVWTVDRRAFLLNPLYRLSWLSRLRRLGATVALQPAFSRVPALGDAMVRASAARERIGLAGDAASTSAVEKLWGDRAYTRLLANPTGIVHEIGRNDYLVTALDIPLPPMRPRPLLPRHAGPGPAGGWPRAPYYVIAPGANSPLRRWPPQRFAAVAGRLYQATGWRGVICGGAGDGPLARQILDAASVPLDDLTGRTDLGQLTRILAGARLLIANDSGAVHIAASEGIPGVSVLGGGQFGRFQPYMPSVLYDFTPPRTVFHSMACFGCDWNCRYRLWGRGPAPCVAGVSVDAVWEAVGAVLGCRNDFAI